jgi:carboxymethylenebutenolidase
MSLTGHQVQIRGRTGEFPGYAVLPPDAKQAVVVIHEIFGPAPEIDRVADRFAAAGYAAAVPDLFYKGMKLACIRRAMQAISRGEGPQIDQLLDTRRWLCDETGVPEDRVGLIGFCLGGGFALAAGRGWGAVSTNYGQVPPAKVLGGIGPVIACYGGRDVPFRAMPARLERRLPPTVAREIHVYPEVGHSFLTDGHHPVASALSWPLLHVRYEPATAEDAWSKILAFFGRHLHASQGTAVPRGA